MCSSGARSRGRPPIPRTAGSSPTARCWRRACGWPMRSTWATPTAASGICSIAAQSCRGAFRRGAMMRDNSARMNPTMTDTTPSAVHLLGVDNGVGLSRDLRLLTATLEARGYRVDFTNTRRRGGIPGLLQRMRGKRHAAQLVRRRRRGLPPPYDFVLMEEHIAPAFLYDAPRRVLLPHPEWFLPRDLQALGRIDLVLTKTREAERVFATQGCRATCIGFTSEDRRDPSVPRERAFFHLAGSSRTKATEPLLALWRRHPECPRLTVVQHPGDAKPATPDANIDHRIGYLDEAELKRLQNAHRFHLCPSETEGFGHYIVEAMSVGAVVITLDAPPMNEMITPERGLLVPYSRTD